MLNALRIDSPVRFAGRSYAELGGNSVRVSSAFSGSELRSPIVAQGHRLGDVDLFHGGIAECHISRNPCNSEYSEPLQGAGPLV